MQNPNCFICKHWNTKRIEIPITNGFAWNNISICEIKKKLFQKFCDEFRKQKFEEVKKL